MWTAKIFARRDFLAQLTGVSKVNLQPKVVFFFKLILSEGKGLYMMFMITYINVSTPLHTRDALPSYNINVHVYAIFVHSSVYFYIYISSRSQGSPQTV